MRFEQGCVAESEGHVNDEPRLGAEEAELAGWGWVVGEDAADPLLVGVEGGDFASCDGDWLVEWFEVP